MKKPLTFLFLGRSGCGKGTQAELLQQALEERDGIGSVLYIYTGKKIRHLSEKDFYTSKITKEIMKSGKLLPAFMAIWAWSDELIKKITPDVHVIFDGSPRLLNEAKIMDEVCNFYKRKETTVPILIDISREEAERRLLTRGRLDDKKEAIEERLDFYNEHVQPTVDYYKNKGLITINGEQSIEKVFEDLKKTIGL